MKRICVTHHICDCNMEQMQKLEKENAKLKLDIEGRKEAYSHLDDINIRLNVEIIRLKEQLKLAESQIDDLKQQVDELNKAVYQENGED